MEKRDFFHLIEQHGIAEPEAIDGIKKTVERIVRRLARGQSVTLPGVGKLIPQVKQSILFQAGKSPRKGMRGGGH